MPLPLVLAAALALAVPPSRLTRPPSVEGEQYKDIPVQANTPAKSVTWIPEGVLRGPPWPHPTDPTRTAVHSRVPGKYKLWCVAAMPDANPPGGLASAVSFVWVMATGPDSAHAGPDPRRWRARADGLRRERSGHDSGRATVDPVRQVDPRLRAFWNKSSFSLIRAPKVVK